MTQDKLQVQWIVVWGSPHNGWIHVGPFRSDHAAEHYVKTHPDYKKGGDQNAYFVLPLVPAFKDAPQ